MAYRKKTRTPRSRRHSSRRTRRPLRRPSASLRSFQKATHTLGPTSPLQLTLLQDLPRAPLGDYRQGYLSSCRLKATICLLGDTPARFLSPSGSLPADTSRSRGILLSPSIPRTFTLRVRLPSGTSEAFQPTSGPLRPHLLFELEDQDSFGSSFLPSGTLRSASRTRWPLIN